MKQIFKRYTILGSLLLLSLQLLAQVDFKLNAPQYVRAGERFKISFTLNEEPEGNINIPELQGFQILMGPSVFSSSNVNIINGKITTKKSFTYSYILLAEKEGKYTIPAASTTIEGKTYESNSKLIEVLPGKNTGTAEQNNSTQPVERQTTPNRGTTTPSRDKKDNFFVRILLSKNTLYPNEHTTATLKLYTRYGGISNVDINPPSFNGFLSKEIPNSGQNQFSQENINGTIYNTAVIGKYVLFPQRSGNINIEDFSIKALAQQRVSSGQSIFDDFFGTNVQQIKVKAVNPKTTVRVLALPSNKPASFNGAVGRFNMTTTLSTDSVSTNEAVTLKVTISGNGNLQMIKAPQLKFSPDLEVYDPKTTNNNGISNAGMNGSVSFEYLIIPRQPGNYTLPSFEFSYFAPSEKNYKKKASETYTLKVARAAGQSSTTIQPIARYQNNKQEVAELGSDIKYIKNKFPHLSKKEKFFLNSLLFWILLLGIPLLFILYFLLAQKYKAHSADTLSNKSKKANKVAIRRLKTAKKSLGQNQKEAFYSHILDALWGFMSDKLHLPLSQLTKDNVYALLQERNIPEESIKEYIDILNESEMAQYAPTDTVDMQGSYQRAIGIISKLEQKL